IARWAQSVPDDIIVFPEVASCGYMYENRKEAEPYVEGLTALRPIERVAQSTGRLIVGGFAERAGRTLYDSAFAAGPSGTTVYRKIHLGNRGTLIFDPGTEPMIVDFEGHPIGLDVRYDLHFPELAAFLAHQGTELVVAPTPRAEQVQRP